MSQEGRENYYNRRSRFGFDRGPSYNDMDEDRFVEKDYHIGGVRLERSGFEAGFDNVRQGQHYGKGPKGWKKTDSKIQEEACEALFENSKIDASHIDINVNDGIVFLKGRVESREVKRLVEQVIDNIVGVKDIYNELEINAPRGIH